MLENVGSLHLADVYVNRCRVAQTYYDPSTGRLWSAVWGTTGGAIGRQSAACAHEKIEDGFVYVEWLYEHWPLRFCRDCLAITAGRSPHAVVRARRPWEYEPQDVIAAKWNERWPGKGRPRRKKAPPSTAWPDTAD